MKIRRWVNLRFSEAFYLLDVGISALHEVVFRDETVARLEDDPYWPPDPPRGTMFDRNPPEAAEYLGEKKK